MAYTKINSLMAAIFKPIISLLLIYFYLLQVDLNKGVLAVHFLIIGFAISMLMSTPLFIYFFITEQIEKRLSLEKLDTFINLLKNDIENFKSEKKLTTDLDKKLELIKRIDKFNKKLIRYKLIREKKKT